MSDVVQLVAVTVSTALLATVLELVRQRKLREEYSFIWLACAVALLVLSLWRNILHVAARAAGIYYPPALLILLLILFVFVVSLYFSVVISRQRQQIETLVEEIALLDAELRELQRSIGAVPASQMVPGPTGNGPEASGQRHLA